MPNISARDALERLKTGNQLYVDDLRDDSKAPSDSRRRELLAGQKPFAIVLGCADSRVPTELVFAQGLGDLFVVRVAGNIAEASQIGSIEFAVLNWDTALVVVLGHSHCGAIAATLGEMDTPSGTLSPSLTAIVEQIQPGLQELSAADYPDRNDRLERAVRANVRVTVEQLGQESAVLRERIESGDLLIVGAEYSLESGQVTFFDD